MEKNKYSIKYDCTTQAYQTIALLARKKKDKIMNTTKRIYQQETMQRWLDHSIKIDLNVTEPIRTLELLNSYKKFVGETTAEPTRGETVIFGRMLKTLIKENNLPIINKKGIYSSYTNIIIKKPKPYKFWIKLFVSLSCLIPCGLSLGLILAIELIK